MDSKRKKQFPTLAVILGDAAGIGPEVIAKALAVERLRRRACFVVVGDQRIVRKGIEVAGRGPEFQVCENEKEIHHQPGKVYVLEQNNLAPGDFAIGQVSEETGRAMGQDLARGVNLVQNGVADGIVYGPLTKAALHLGGYDVTDELHYLAHLAKMPAGAVFGEINKMGRLWLGRVTSHVAIKDVAHHVTQDSILNALQLLAQTITSYGTKSPRILVAALNPHAGDGGLFGTEEEEIIVPVIAQAQNNGIFASGPYPSDTIFLRYLRRQGNGILAMYHDQGQIGAKLLGFSKTVTICAGLPLVAVTPAHGSSFELAGKGQANELATKEAFQVAIRLAAKRKRQ
ncbi:MAG: PdxA family dehydrogenase [Bacillota bacterium]